MEIKKEQIKKLHEGLRGCPEAQEAVRNAFPEVFREEWEEIPISAMTLQRRSEVKYLREIGVLTSPEDYFMPYNVEFADIWGGEREDGNPMTDLFVYKLVNGRIQRKKRY